MSPQGIAFLKQIEQFSPVAYPDAGSGYDIGYGFQTWRGRPVTLDYPGIITPAQADHELRIQLRGFEAQVRAKFTTLPQPAFDAMVSVCYDLGHVSTTIWNKVRAHTRVTVNDFLVTAKIGDDPHPALVRRRMREFLIFLGRYHEAKTLDLDTPEQMATIYQKLLRETNRP
jgi:GH24 family phage-related lysozyme (muramidase)